MASDINGNLYIADPGSSAIRFINKQTGIVTTIAGMMSTQGSSGDNGPATSATLYGPQGINLDAIHNVLYIADQGNHKIRLVTFSTGIITTYAGTGFQGSFGDGGSAINAQLNSPNGVASDGSSGNVYISDYQNNKIRKVNSAGIITTYAGGGMSFPGDGLQATAVTLSYPQGIAADKFGNVYIADTGHYIIR